MLRTYMLDKQRAWISGENDVESDWDNYQAELKNKRLDLVIDALQDAYDRQRES